MELLIKSVDWDSPKVFKTDKQHQNIQTGFVLVAQANQ